MVTPMKRNILFTARDLPRERLCKNRHPICMLFHLKILFLGPAGYKSMKSCFRLCEGEKRPIVYFCGCNTFIRSIAQMSMRVQTANMVNTIAISSIPGLPSPLPSLPSRRLSLRFADVYIFFLCVCVLWLAS